jgi:hypothetical protein
VFIVLVLKKGTVKLIKTLGVTLQRDFAEKFQAFNQIG